MVIHGIKYRIAKGGRLVRKRPASASQLYWVSHGHTHKNYPPSKDKHLDFCFIPAHKCIESTYSKIHIEQRTTQEVTSL